MQKQKNRPKFGQNDQICTTFFPNFCYFPPTFLLFCNSPWLFQVFWLSSQTMKNSRWSLVFNNNNNNNNNHITALCPGLPGWAGTRRNTHPPTILITIQSLLASSIYYDPQNPPHSNYMLGNLFAQPLSTGIQTTNKPMYTSADPVRSERSVGSCGRIRSTQPGNCSGQQHGTARGRDGSTTDGTSPGCGLRSETVCSLPVHCRHRKHLDTQRVCNSKCTHTCVDLLNPYYQQKTQPPQVLSNKKNTIRQ